MITSIRLTLNKQLVNSLTCLLVNSLTRQLVNSSTILLKYLRIESTSFFLWQWSLEEFLESSNQLRDNEWLSLNLVILIRREVVDTNTQEGCKLTKILFCNNNFLVTTEHFCCVLWQWIHILELCQSNLMSLTTQHLHS